MEVMRNQIMQIVMIIMLMTYGWKTLEQQQWSSFEQASDSVLKIKWADNALDALRASYRGNSRWSKKRKANEIENHELSY